MYRLEMLLLLLLLVLLLGLSLLCVATLFAVESDTVYP